MVESYIKMKITYFLSKNIQFWNIEHNNILWLI